jgi:hypothetical protein
MPVYFFERACLALKKKTFEKSDPPHNPRKRTHQLGVEVEDGPFFLKKSCQM